MAADNLHFILALAIFIGTYGAIVLRNIKGGSIPVWSVMLAGAVAMVFSNVISVPEAYSSINLEVIVFLFSMFVFVTAMDVSGLLESFTTKLFLKAKKPEDIIYLTFFGFGFASSILMNDTLALMGTPIMLSLAKKMKISSKPLLLTLAFSVTIGSTMTPMGNPQNLLIALVSGIPAPVITFILYLILPTIVNLFVTYLLLRRIYRSEFLKAREKFTELIRFEASMKDSGIEDSGFARKTLIILSLTVSGIVIINVLEAIGIKQGFGISEVSLLGATVLLLSSSKRREILKKMDWGILLMFASLFVLMQAVWNAGIVTELSKYLPPLDKSNSMVSLISILASSVLLSQVLSNVPMVALFLPVMKSVGYGPSNISSWVALAGGSTLAGNLTLLGAASNLIIVEEAEAKGHSLGFFEFFKIGILVTVVNIIVLYLFLMFLP